MTAAAEQGAWQIKRVEHRDDGTFLGMTRRGWLAEVTTAGHTLLLSRLDGESEWKADAHFGPGSYPHFVHGFGERAGIHKQVLGDEALAGRLDAEVRRLACSYCHGPLDADGECPAACDG